MNSIKPKNKPIKKNKRKPRVKGRRLPNNRKRKTNIIRGRKIAAASAKTFNKKFNVLRQNGNSVRVTGRDLIYSIPDDLKSPIQDSNVITVIPANPAYWKGTRIAALAAGYQNYRPILFKITYIPMCAVTQQGNVIGGTIWDDGLDNANIQQSLRTSNGGFMTQCYVPHTTRIRPKSNLQFNLYRMGGDFSTTSNPFIFIAIAVGCKNQNQDRIVPGYFYVTWSFELKNPIGSINTFNNSGLIKYEDIHDELNTTIINLDPNSEIPFGAYINIEEVDGELVPYYNDTPIEILGSTPTWVFTSVAKTSTTRNINKIPIIYNGVTTSEIILKTNGYKGYIQTHDDYYDIYFIDYIESDVEYHLEQQNTILLINDTTQNFGERLGVSTVQFKVYINGEYSSTSNLNIPHFKASKSNYVAQLYNPNRKNKTVKNSVRYLITSALDTKTDMKEDASEETKDIISTSAK